MLRLFLFSLTIFLALFTHWIVFLVGALSYVVLFPGYELVIAGLLVDAYYGQTGSWPFYTTLNALMVLVASFVRPYLSLK